MSRLQTLLDQFLSDGTTKMKLAILTFLYCEEFVKNPNRNLKKVFRIMSTFVELNKLILSIRRLHETGLHNDYN